MHTCPSEQPCCNARAQRLVAEWPGAGLACLPNYAFALPLGRWQRAQQRAALLAAALTRAAGRGGAAAGRTLNPKPGGHTRGEEEEGADGDGAAAGEALAQAVLLHPLAVVRLMEQCGRPRRCCWQPMPRADAGWGFARACRARPCIVRCAGFHLPQGQQAQRLLPC